MYFWKIFFVVLVNLIFQAKKLKDYIKKKSPNAIKGFQNRFLLN